jgi:Xaa-Pro aminopeptidase
MDVHDVGDYKIDDEWRVLEPGMVLTIEPGLYVPHDCLSVNAKWRGIGIRIEDDILVTEQGYQVLTYAIPKTIADISSAINLSTSPTSRPRSTKP